MLAASKTSKSPIRTVLITGATSGLGQEAARVIASGALGPHNLIVASRNPSKVASTIAALIASYPTAATRIYGLTIDVGSLASVAEAVEELEQMELEKGVKVDTLVENAGITGPEEKAVNKDGIEVTFATNHVGHYLLEKLLLPRMVANAEAIGTKPRVVIVSSGTHDPANHTPLPAPVFDLQEWVDPVRYAPFQAYTNSKLANALHGNDLAQSTPALSVATYCPGFIADTSMGSENLGAMRLAFSVGVRAWLNVATWWYDLPNQVSELERSGAFLARLAVEPELVSESGTFHMIDSKWRTSEVARDRKKQVELREFTEGLLRERGYKWMEV
ncbi:hypothetical protein HDU96_010997 [Phlyctochytrium bullatum]|nr:hypothetical protein HDU96_010997 [Phlyctochytrium bullatum]